MKTLKLILLFDIIAAICALCAVVLSIPIEPWGVLCWIIVALQSHIKEYKQIKNGNKLRYRD